MKPEAADVQRWSEEVARDPGAPSFVPLARTYRRQGRRDAALRVLLRGLERNPTHVDAHTTLALLYLEAGERQKAWDEWATALRLDGENFEANRGVGFLQLEQGDWGAAAERLDRAARARPGDGAVADALRLAEQKVAGGAAPAAEATPPPPSAPAGAPAAAARSEDAGTDPEALFAALEGEAPFLGALLLDAQGLVLAGRLAEAERQRGELLGALLGGTLEEAGRAAEHLDIGAWSGLMLESEQATIHVAPAAADASVLLAVRSGTPAGWVRRAAKRAEERARAFLERSS